ncbi:MAG: zf-TFIIB domain-containing protein, partial [Elusimicrobiales bacterium]|nr:zf-TFIIB domain-containing protein [Elusimicrobiales bacterium]
LPCPRCKSKMSRGGLVNPLLLVDKCDSCGGVWLDPRELTLLKKLLNLTGGETHVEVERPAPAPAAPPVKKNPLLKYTLALAALIGLAMVSYELYVYFSPEGSVTGHFSTAAASFGFVMLAGGGIGTIKVK